MQKAVILIVTLVLALAAPASVHAQQLRDFIEMFGGVMSGQPLPTGIVAEWQNVPEADRHCLNAKLRKKGSSIDQLAVAGIGPEHSSVSGIRAECTSQHEPSDETDYPFKVSDIVLGSQFNSIPGQSQFQCSPSELFNGATWCERLDKGRYLTLLHWNGEIFYVSNQLNAASFKPGEMVE